MQDRPRIVLCYPVEPRHIAQIQRCLPSATVVDAGQERVAAELPGADIFCGHPKVPVPWADVVAAGRLRWIQSSAAGLDHCLVPSVVESPIVVTSASGVLADQVAEHTLALLTACTRRIPLFLAQQARREFVRRPTRDLTGATVVIVGLGGNGRRLVEVLAPFRVRILATDWFPVRKPAAVEFLGGPDTLPDLLPQADVLILAAPLTDHTRDMIDAAALARLKPGAILVNVARGPLVVEDALADALESGQLDSAGIDVTPDEPPAAASRLWTAPRLVITPHVGGQAADRIDAMTDFFCDNLRRYGEGRPLVNLVDKRLGFPEPPADILE
ncbi:MAG: D-2-hydroxyacid dehydrogenase [Planctomycetia bacterium]|nr:D-2-hydroxyacid dehydrogenase [Planctomycetia bacterium]